MGAGRYFVLSPEGDLETLGALADALARRGQGRCIWLDYTDPCTGDLSDLIEPLGLHPLAVEDCLDEDQVPKMDEFANHTFILFNRYRTEDRAARVEEVNFFLGKDFLVSVHSHGSPDQSLGKRLEATVRRDIVHARRGADFLLQVILDDIVDEKFDAIEALQDELDRIEDEMLRTDTEFRPGRLVRLRRELLALRKSLVYEREILVKICRRDSPYISDEAIYDYRDIYDHLAKFFEVVEICRELIGSIMEIHLSIINNRMTVVANKTNFVMRRLTMITTVFMPLTLLAGVGGMSEWSMITGSENWRISYPAFLIAMAAIGIANYYLLKWFDARDPVTRMAGSPDLSAELREEPALCPDDPTGR
jgi:magnesium transporter